MIRKTVFWGLAALALGATASHAAAMKRLEHDEKSMISGPALVHFRNGASPEVRQWVAAQNQKVISTFRQTADGKPDPFFEALALRMKEIVPKNLPPVTTLEKGELWVRAGSLVFKSSSGEERVLAEKIVHEDKTGVSVVAEYKVSLDEKRVAYSYIKNGGDVSQWHVRDIATGELLTGPVAVRMSDFTFSLDGRSVFYTQWPTEAEARAGFFYSRNIRRDLATGAEELVFESPAKDGRFWVSIEDFVTTRGQTKLVAHRIQGPAEVPLAVYLGEKGAARREAGEFQVGAYRWRTVRNPVIDRLGKFVTAYKGQLILRTTEENNGFGLIAVDSESPSRVRPVFSSRPDETLLVAQRVRNVLILQSIKTGNFENIVRVITPEGAVLRTWTPGEFGYPEQGALSPVTGSYTSEWAYFSYNAVELPPVTLRINTRNLEIEALKPSAEIDFDTSRIERRLVHVKSADGTEIPVELFTRKDIAKPAFAYLYGYGYIGIFQPSMWNRKFQAPLELGGMVAIAHIRGGGDAGRDWQMGVKINRMASQEDTAAVARWLKSPDGLAVPKVVTSGRSFGGMHALGSFVHFQDAFDAFVSVVPVADIHEFLNRGLFGRAALDDFGVSRTPVGNVLDTNAYRNLLSAWSPFQNLKQVKSLKPLIVFTADTDERTGPEQSYAVVDALNRQFPGNSDVYLYEEKFNGHVARAEITDEAAFIAKTFGITELKLMRKPTTLVPNHLLGGSRLEGLFPRRIEEPVEISRPDWDHRP